MKKIWKILCLLVWTVLPLKCRKRNNLSYGEIFNKIEFAELKLKLGIGTTPIDFVDCIHDANGNPSDFLQGYCLNGVISYVTPISDFILFHEMIHRKHWVENKRYKPYCKLIEDSFKNDTFFLRKWAGRLKYYLLWYETDACYYGYRLAFAYNKHKNKTK